MFTTAFKYFCLVFATLPYSGGSDEQVGFMWPFRNGRFFPGLIIDTFWCGSGNVSRGLYELGPNFLVDSCCRSHDLCDVFIEPGETKYNVKNNGQYTISSCTCNWAFYNCLHARFRCRSPGNDYNKNPCKGYRTSENAADDKNLCSTSENRCEIYDVTDEYDFVDSPFKTHQLQLDQQKKQATTRSNYKEQNMMMLHRFHPPPPPQSSSLFVPTVLQLVHGSP